MRKSLLFLTMTIFYSCAAIAQDIIISKPWMRPGIAGSNTAVYLLITNNGKVDHELVDAESQVAVITEIHKTVMENDISKMVRVDKIVIPAGQTVALQPKGMHIMLMNLKHDLNVGSVYELVLSFKGLETQVVQVPVKQG